MRISTKLLSLCAVLAFSACSESSNVGPDFEPGMAVVPVMVSAAPGLSTLVVEVSATDMTTPLAYNLTMVDGTASDTITIPAGSDRTITVRGYDSNNIETHRGSTVTNLVEGSNTAVTVTLDPLAGDQPVVVVMGGVTVEISPAVDTVAVGSTIQLTGVVLNDQGDTLEVTPVWSTLNPAVATVDSTGLVTGVSSGSASIVGAYDGMGAQTIVTVFEPFFLAENGVTVVCTDAQVGDTGVVNGVTYTKRDRAGLDALLVEAESSGDYSGFSTTCTTGVTSLFSLLYTGVVPGPHDAFNEDISSWDVSSVTDMGNMAQGVSSFNADLRAWDLGLVSNLDGMLNGTAFNQDVSGWDISSARFMRELFSATPFNQDISGWDVSQVEAMGFMFAENSVFAQDLSGWDVSSVTDFDTMFRNASSFNADLSGWCVTSSDGVLREFDANTPSWTLPKPVWGTCSAASTVQSTTTADIASIPANGLATTNLTVQLRDASGVNLTASAGALTFAAPSQGSVGSIVDHSDGTYSAVYTAGSTPGTVTLTPQLDGGLKSLSSIDIELSPTFFLAENGVTVVCTDAQVGDTGVVNGITYTKRDRAGLDALLVEAESSGDYSGFSTTCTTGVTSLFSLLYTGVVPGPHDAFNEDISSWDVSSVTDMGNMAQGVSSFNADLRAWDLGLVSNLDGMLNGTAFNQDVSGWDISSARFMRELFSATPFNQDISGWDVSQVEAMGFMFAENSVFAQDLSGWDVSSVTDFDTMFRNASSFNADLSGWCVTSSDGVLREFDANTPSWTLPKPVWGTCSPASVLQSTLTANTTAIPAGGFSTVTLTVQLKDAAGVDLTDNTRTLTFDTPSQGSISAVTVNNDGTYTATYTSGSDIGTVTIVARLDGIAMTQTVVISLET